MKVSSMRSRLIATGIAVILLVIFVSAAVVYGGDALRGPTADDVKNGNLTTGGGVSTYPEYDPSLSNAAKGRLCLPVGSECGPDDVMPPDQSPLEPVK
jgi:hypothetical protein